MFKNPDEMHNIVIFGASGHGNVVLDCIEREGKYNFIGFIDSFLQKGTDVGNYSVLGSEHDLPELIEKHDLFGGIIAIGDNWTRNLIVDRISKIITDFKYVIAIHPSAEIGKDVQIGQGSVVMPGVTINAHTIIGSHCILNTNSTLDHDGFMNHFSSLAPSVCVGGNFILGKGSAICLGSNIIENITIGPHSVIGAGSLVVGNIGSHVLVYGSPAKVIRKRISGEKYLRGSKKDSTIIPLRVKEF